MQIGTTLQERQPVPVIASDDGSLRTIPSLAGRDASALLEGVPTQRGGVVADAALEIPFRPSKIVAIGLNYRDHVRETGMDQPKQPLVFAKFPSSLVVSGRPLVIVDELTHRADWEAELAVIIGREAHDVTEARALDHVWGYAVANDVSARDVQFADGQWVRGKSMDTFCPVSALFVSRDEVVDPQDLRLQTRVNGEVMQDSTTAEMIFSVAELIAFCSRSFTMLPGDLLLTGTPWGCGEFMDPPRHLHDGDLVEVEIPGVGAVTNRVEVRAGA